MYIIHNNHVRSFTQTTAALTFFLEGFLESLYGSVTLALFLLLLPLGLRGDSMVVEVLRPEERDPLFLGLEEIANIFSDPSGVHTQRVNSHHLLEKLSLTLACIMFSQPSIQHLC